MHNIHYIVVEADSHKDAQSEVEAYLFGYGDEDNYFSFIGSLSRDDGSIAKGNSDRWDVDKLNTKKIQETINLEYKYEIPTKDVVIGVYDGSIDNGLDSYKVARYFEYLREKNSTHDNIWKARYYSEQYDKVGITNLTFSDKNNYIVAIDMHSV